MNRYWDSTGKYQDLYNVLNERIPSMGAVPNSRTSNRKLEKLRQAANCYYDLFNNGLCNRAAQFRRVFGRGGTAIAKYDHFQAPWLEVKMDEIIEQAAVEQGLLTLLKKNG